MPVAPPEPRQSVAVTLRTREKVPQPTKPERVPGLKAWLLRTNRRNEAQWRKRVQEWEKNGGCVEQQIHIPNATFEVSMDEPYEETISNLAGDTLKVNRAFSLSQTYTITAHPWS